MLSHTDCPDQITLEKVLLGRLRGAEAELWEDHVATCSLCVGALAGLAKQDPLTEHLGKSRAREGELKNEVVQQLIQQLQNLLPMAPEGQQAGPGAEGQPTTPVPSRTASGTDEDYRFLDAPESSDELGRLAQYRVLKKLGHGGMGMVFLAEDRNLQRSVALKVMLPRLLGDANNRQRFLREARAAAAIAHDRVVTIHHVDEANGVPFLTMQLLQGESLEARLGREPGPWPLAVILRMGREIAEGLGAAHQLGVVHRDIKPSNIWLEGPLSPLSPWGRGIGGEGEHIKLLDFGLAHVSRDTTRLTQPGVIVGTPGFLAPEQATGKPADPRSDLFSLGVVLYLLATGHMPFAGENVLAVLTALAIEHPRPVFELNPELPEALTHLIMRLLSKEPDRRPHSAREVVDILAAIERQQVPGDRTAWATPQPARGRPARRPNRYVWWTSLAGVGIVLALALWSLSHPVGPPSDDIQRAPTTELQATVVRTHVAKLELARAADAAVFSPDGKYVLSAGNDRVVRVWDVGTGKPVRLFAQTTSPYHAMALSRDGRLLVTGCGHYITENKQVVAKECLVQVWDVNNGKELAHLEGPLAPVCSVAISDDGKRILSGGPWDYVRLWDREARCQKAKFGTPEVGNKAVAISHDGKWGLFTDGDPWVAVMDLDKGAVVDRFQGNASGRLRAVAFSPDGTQGLSAGWGFRLEGGSFLPIDCTIHLWDMRTRAELKSFIGHGAAIASAVISPDGRFVLSGGGTIARPDGNKHVFDCAVHWWDIESSQELARFEGHTAPIRAVAVSPDGRVGLSVGEDHTIRLWGLPVPATPGGKK
jgi:serine/threonine protein kinase/WD40 repeat protein